MTCARPGPPKNGGNDLTRTKDLSDPQEHTVRADYDLRNGKRRRIDFFFLASRRTVLDAVQTMPSGRTGLRNEAGLLGFCVLCQRGNAASSAVYEPAAADVFTAQWQVLDDRKNNLELAALLADAISLPNKYRERLVIEHPMKWLENV